MNWHFLAGKWWNKSIIAKGTVWSQKENPLASLLPPKVVEDHARCLKCAMGKNTPLSPNQLGLSFAVQMDNDTQQP